jgi:hypothetical protein
MTSYFLRIVLIAPPWSRADSDLEQVLQRLGRPYSKRLIATGEAIMVIAISAKA